MKKIINLLIDEAVQNADTYTNNGSTWLIFTDDKRWVIELTKEGTLWYNYNFFKSLFAYTSMDVVENQNYITNWVEDNIINKKKPVQNGVKSTRISYIDNHHLAEDTLQNGVKHTIDTTHHKNKYVEDTIQNGVKETKNTIRKATHTIEDTIQNGVKETKIGSIYPQRYVEKIMQNGVKHTQSSIFDNPTEVKNTIKNGVKNIRHSKSENDSRAENTIQNGVKHTSWLIKRNSQCVEDDIQNGVKKTVPIGIDKDSIVSNDFGMNQAIQNGVIHTRFLSNNRAEYVEHTIENGVKKTYSDKIPHEYDWSDQFTEDVEDAIQNGVKHTEKSLQIDGSCVIEDVIKEGVIEHGIKETKSEVATREWKAGEVINNGVKETTPGGYLGSVEMKGKTVHQFEHAKQDDDVKDVIKNGIKKTVAAALFDEESKMDTVISNGIKETHDDAYHHTGRVEGVIKNGVKQCIPSRTPIYNPMDFSVEYRENHRLDDVTSVLKKGIKEVQPLPSQEGNMDYSNYYYRQGDRTIPHTQYVDDVIENGKKFKI